MDNFKRKRKLPRNSVDGMLTPPGSTSTGFHRAKKPGPQGSSRHALDNFTMSEGLHRPKQQAVAVSRPQNAQPKKPLRDRRDVIDMTLPDQPKKKAKGWRRLIPKHRWSRITAVIIICLVLIFGFLFVKGYIKLRHIFRGGGNAIALNGDVDPNSLHGEGDGRVNILLLGRGGGNHDAPDLTDTILVASIDPINKKAGILSIPRDLWVQPEGMGAMKINAVFALTKYAAQAQGKSAAEAESEGFAALEKEVSTDIGIPIHYHVLVDFKAFEDAINTVGGVDINVDASGVVYEQLWDELAGSNYTLDVREGQQHFDGQRALYYARSRHTSARGDFDRAERQRKLLLALKDKVLSAGTYSNPARISALISNFGDHVQTNMTIDEVLRLYDIVKDVDNGGVSSIGLVDPPDDFLANGFIDGQSVLLPKAGMGEYAAIQSFVRNKLKDGFITKEDPEIIVLNGTNVAGLAQKRADELKSYGYRVTKIADAPTKNYQHTVLVDMRSGQKKYTKRYLELRLGTTTVDQLPDGIDPGTADFVIIIGQNESP